MCKLGLVHVRSTLAAVAVLLAASAEAQTAPLDTEGASPLDTEGASPGEPAPLAPASATAVADAPAPTPVTSPVPTPAAPILESAPAGGTDPKADEAVTPTERAQAIEEEPSSDGSVTLSGYAEAYYSHNFARPDNRITNNRWMDEAHNSFTLQTVALDVDAQKGPVSAKLTLMFGPTADRWYFEGAQIPASDTDLVLPARSYSNETWKHIQQAYASYVAPLGEGLTITGGLMTTQIGFEAAAVKDNWNWSRSNLFNFLPFFHVGARVSYPLTDSLTVTGAVYNGANQASDLNNGKTVSLQTSYLTDKVLFNLLYLGGVERVKGDAAGEPWRNLFDAVVQYDVLPMLSLGTNLDGGFERNELGVQSWFAAAFYARAKATDWLYFALRGDGIFEQNATRQGVESPILLGGSDHVLSGTVTAEIRPIEGVSFRLEYRHDDSDADVPFYYKKGFDASGLQRTSSVQNTLTLGMTGWF